MQSRVSGIGGVVKFKLVKPAVRCDVRIIKIEGKFLKWSVVDSCSIGVRAGVVIKEVIRGAIQAPSGARRSPIHQSYAGRKIDLPVLVIHAEIIIDFLYRRMPEVKA